MKNIYEDSARPLGDAQKGNNQVTEGAEAQSSATRPKKHATQPPLAQQANVQYGMPPQQVQPIPNGAVPVYYTPYGYVPVMQQPIQGVPVQSVPMQGVPVQNVPPQGYAQYPVGQFYYPAPQQGYVPQQAVPQSEKVNTEPENNAPDPGTRVLFQSEDFERKAAEPVEDDYVVDFSQGTITKTDVKQETVFLEDVSLEDIMPVVTPVAPEVHKITPDVSVDDMEMSNFEFNAMAKHRHSSAKPIKQPGQKKQAVKPVVNANIEVEETEEVISLADEPKPQEKKKISRFELIRRIILGISLVAIVVSVTVLANQYRLASENDSVQEDVSNLIIDTTKETTTKKSNKTEKTTKKQEQTTKPLTPEQQWENIKKEYPNVIFPAGIQLKYAKLYAENNDFVGYLSADGVNMNLPIVQTTNDSYYLDRNFYKSKTKYGCPFVTHLNNIEPLDMNTVIFGHHMNNGTVFGALDKYKTIDGFKAAPIIEFNTLYKDYKWKVIAAFVTNAYEKDDNGYIFRYYFTSLSTEERYSAYLNELAQRSLYDTGVDVLPTDKILTLSTCSHEFTDARFVVVARLVRDGEIAEVDTSRATVNQSPRYPQAYYTKKGLKNPYKNASQWEVG